MERRCKLGLEIKTMANLFCRRMGEETLRRGAAVTQLTPMQLWVIEYLYENREKDVFQRDLEGEFQVRRSTATGILQGLERKGLVERQVSAHDGRLKKLTLTAEAIAIHENMLGCAESIEKVVLKDISEEEWESFQQVLEKIKKNLAEAIT